MINISFHYFCINDLFGIGGHGYPSKCSPSLPMWSLNTPIMLATLVFDTLNKHYEPKLWLYLKLNE